jgi:hypothetical protein
MELDDCLIFMNLSHYEPMDPHMDQGQSQKRAEAGGKDVPSARPIGGTSVGPRHTAARLGGEGRPA